MDRFGEIAFQHALRVGDHFLGDSDNFHIDRIQNLLVISEHFRRMQQKFLLNLFLVNRHARRPLEPDPFTERDGIFART
ncbi:hypothetical protein D3C85_1425540 [compost metagenome]